jgi:hypothetical protein
LIGPIDTNRTRTQPFTVHGCDGLLRICFVPESEEAISARLPRIHIPHYPRIGHGTKSAESFGEDVVIDFGTEVTDEYMIMTGRVFLILLSLVGPVDTDLCVEDLASIEGLEGGFRSTHIDVFHEAVV